MSILDRENFYKGKIANKRLIQLLKYGIIDVIVMKPSAKFTNLTKQTGLFNIQAIDNIPSIMRKVLLSNEKAKNIKHTSIAMNEIQDRRKLVKIPNGFIIYRILCQFNS